MSTKTQARGVTARDLTATKTADNQRLAPIRLEAAERSYTHLTAHVLEAAFPEAAARAIEAGVRVTGWTKYAPGRRVWYLYGLKVSRGEASAYVAFHGGEIAAAAVRAKVLSLFEVPS